MKKVTAILVLMGVLGFNVFSYAQTEDDNHTPDVCTNASPQVCVHLGHFTAFNTTDEARFIVHIMTPQNVPVDHVAVDLWMPSAGHGSSPVAVSQVDENHYRVQQAYFVMSGQWLVRVRFILEGVTYQLSVPVDVTE